MRKYIEKFDQTDEIHKALLYAELSHLGNFRIYRKAGIPYSYQCQALSKIVILTRVIYINRQSFIKEYANYCHLKPNAVRKSLRAYICYS
jgi:hypothetical protein